MIESTKQHWSLMLRSWKKLEDLHKVSTKHSGNVSLAETNCPQHPDVTLHYETLPSGRQPHSWWPYFLASLSPLGMIMGLNSGQWDVGGRHGCDFLIKGSWWLPT